MAAEHSRRFADLLRDARRAAGLTQEELAERAGLSVRALSKLESGASQSPRRDTIALLAAALGLGETERAAFAQAVHRQLSRSGHQRRHPTTGAADLPLIGRTREVVRLAYHLAGAGPPVLLLAGEPGVGKTRLLREAAMRASRCGWRVLEGGCYRREGQEPYAPVLGALAWYMHQQSSARLRAELAGCSWLVRLLPELAETSLVPVPEWTLPSDQERRLMIAAVGRFLANIAGPAGTLLVLDDLHWAGADALDLLAMLLRAAPDRPLQVIGAYRSTDVRPEHALAATLAELARDGRAEQIVLDPLDTCEAAALLDSLLEGAEEIEAGWPERVLRRACGVPYYLVSCARALREGALQGGNTASVSDVPWDVAETIRQRVVVLSAEAQRLLGAAAVLGGTVSSIVLAEMAAQAEDTALDALRAACRARLLVDEGEDAYRFAHDLVREVVEADLGVGHRKLLHRRAAEAIERSPGEPPVERLAYHYARGGVPEKAVIYLQRAGDRALALFAHAEAEGYYREVVELLDGLGRAEEVAGAREKLAATLIAQARYDEALRELERSMGTHRAVGNREGLWQATAQMGWVHASRGTPEAGIACLQQLYASQSAQEPSHGLAALQVALAHLYLHAGRYEQSVTAAEHAARLSRAAGDEHLLTQAETSRGTALLHQGRAMEARQVLDGALMLAEASGDVPDLVGALENAGDTSLFLGEFNTCKRYAERALAIAERLGDLSAVASALFRHGVISYFLGDWAQARQDFERAMRLIGWACDSWLWMPLSLHLGELGMAEGHPETAQHLHGFIDLIERKSEHTELSAERNDGKSAMGKRGDLGLLHAHNLLAERDLLEGHPEAALARLEPLWRQPELAENVGVTEMLSLLAWAHLAIGAEAQAETLLTQCLQPAIAERYHLAQVEALRVQAMLAVRRRDWLAGKVALDKVLALCRVMPYPYAEAKALYVYGQLHAAQGQPEQAREQYQAALAICQRLGEGLYRPQIERALAQMGVPPS